MKYQVLARKYRPESFDDVQSQDHIVKIFKNAIESNRVGQAYLFTGSRGVGKTSVARILAKSLNCKVAMSATPCQVCDNCKDIKNGVSADVIEIDGASNTGVDDVRELQKELLYAVTGSRYKIIIIDEVHMLSKNAFNALLKTLEEPLDKIVFIFATTEPHKVLPTIISRCQKFDFKRIPVETIVKRLKEIAIKENINIDTTALYPIAKRADGGMRDALTLLDQVISYGDQHITIKEVEKIFGLVSYDIFNKIMFSVQKKNPQEIITLFHEIKNEGTDIQEFINDFLEYLRQMIFLKYGLNIEGIAKEILETMQNIAKDFTEDELLYILNYLIETKNNLRTSALPEVLAELTFIKIAKITEMKSLKTILDNLSSGKIATDNAPNSTQTLSIPPPQKKDIVQIAPSFSSQQLSTQDSSPTNIYLTEDLLKQNWKNLIDQIKVEHHLSASFFETAKIKDIKNNIIYFTHTSEIAINKLISEKSIYETMFTKIFRMTIRLSFEHLPEAKSSFIKNPTLDIIEKESPNVYDFINVTDSMIRQEK
ncbi:MAG: DNA polymerase III subunit gamma/tau [Candidatus Cloacimonetes bacterium]|nr:DNA polymerase III subunit gamma/tau [Candidatus Cloacimonadota bacterium]